MRILVTGHLGYIGTVMVPMLLERGHEVVGSDTDLYQRCTFGAADPGAAARVPNLGVDLRDMNAAALGEFQAVIHLAALSNDPLGALDPRLTDSINYVATVALARAAKAAGVARFVFASSCSNYGAAAEDFLDETSGFTPVTAYGRSKVAAEHALLDLADSAFSPTLLRSATAYGLSPRLRFDLVLNNLTAWAFTTGDVFLKSDGTPWRPVVHVGDIARAFAATIEAPRELVHAEAFNVGRTDENYRIAELAEIVRSIVPGAQIRMSPQAGPDTRCYRVNCDKLARVMPAARPQWTVERGVGELYDAFRHSQLTLAAFEGPVFQRLAHLKMRRAAGEIDADLRPRVAADAT
jgi:nucleoside-diphosphate-sugar epimerase